MIAMRKSRAGMRVALFVWISLIGGTAAAQSLITPELCGNAHNGTVDTYVEAGLRCEAGVEALLAWGQEPANPNVTISSACMADSAPTRSGDWLRGRLLTHYTLTPKQPPPGEPPTPPVEQAPQAYAWMCRPVVLGGDEQGDTPADAAKTVGEAPAGNDVGDPIDTATGHVYRQDVDAEVGRWLRFVRSYSSASDAEALGPRWTHTYARRLQWVPPTPAMPLLRVRVLHDDGKVLTYRYVRKQWQPEVDSADVLTWRATTDGEAKGFTLTRPGVGTVETYTAQGELARIEGPDGQAVQLTHAEDRLVRIVDPSGRALALGYDAAGRLATLTTPDGRVTHYAYDANGALAEVRYPGGGVRAYRYDEPAHSAAPAAVRLTGVLDAQGQRLATYDYQADGRAIATTLAGGTQRYTIAYHPDGRTTTTDPFGRAVTRQYTTIAGVPRVASLDTSCESCGDVAAWRYNAQGLPIELSGFDGQRTQLSYNDRQRETRRVEAVGTAAQRTWTTRWSNTDDLTVQRDLPLQRDLLDAQDHPLRRDLFDYAGSLTRQPSLHCQIDPVKAPDYRCEPLDFTPAPAGVRRTSYMYCAMAMPAMGCPLRHLLQYTLGPAGMTTYAYYTETDESGCANGGACHRLGDLKSIGSPYATQPALTIVAYDTNGRITRQRDAHGVISETVYHPRGWPLEQIVRARPDGTPSASDAITRFTYDDEGRVLTRTDADGVALHYSYDAAGRAVAITDASGHRVQRTLDAVGNVLDEHVLDANAQVQRRTRRSYTARGQLDRLTDGLGRAIFQSPSYDAAGRLVQYRDALGRERQQRFDARGRLNVAVDDAAGVAAETLLAYDAADRLEGVSDPDGLGTSYDYDGLDQRTGLHSPDTGDTRTTYDAAGHVLTQTDAQGITRRYQYDLQGRPTEVRFSEARHNVSVRYDESDAITGCSGSQAQAHLTRLIKADAITAYCYDPQGRVIEKRQTRGEGAGAHTDVVRYAYTPAGRLRRQVQPGGTAIDFTYDGAGRLASIIATPQGGATTLVVSGLTYRADGSVASYQLGNGQTITRQFDANGNISAITSDALALAFERDAAGQVVGITEAGTRTAYAYDGLGRLIDVRDAQGQAIASYSYSKAGDRLSKQGASYGYQAGSHRLIATGTGTRSVDDTGSTTASQWDGEHYDFAYDPDQQVESVQRNGQPVARYTYNAQGERIAKAVTLPQPLEQRFIYNEASQLIAERGSNARDYVWMGDIPVVVIDADQGNALHYIHADHLGTPRALTNGAGETVWAWKLGGDPFGEQAPSTQSTTFNLRFPGQYFDAETGLHYNMRRYYDARAGRYITSDPIGLRGGPNTYGYVDASPLNYIDPLGTTKWTVQMFGISSPVWIAGVTLARFQATSEIVNGRNVYVEGYISALDGGVSPGAGFSGSIMTMDDKLWYLDPMALAGDYSSLGFQLLIGSGPSYGASRLGQAYSDWGWTWAGGIAMGSIGAIGKSKLTYIRTVDHRGGKCE